MVLGQYGAVLVRTWWYLVSMKRNWFIHDGTGSEEGGCGWYLVSRWRYWLIHDGTGSVWGSTCWNLVVLDQYKAVMVDP